MNPSPDRRSRRRFVTYGIAALGFAPLVGLPARVAAQELPRLEESDPTAKALGYVHDAATVDIEERRNAANVCANCRLYTGGDAEWGPCSLFPGKAVAAQGWCKGWVAQS